MLTRPFSLDMTPCGVPLIINVSQYDDDQELVLSLFSSQGVLDVPSENINATFRGTKLDGNGISAGCVLDFDNDGVPFVTIKLTKQMTAIAGRNPFEVVLWQTINDVTYELPSSTFYLNVKRAAMDYATIDSDSDIMEIIDVLSMANQLIEAANDIQEAAALIEQGGYAGQAELQELQNQVNELSTSVESVRLSLSTKVQGGYIEDDSLYLTTGSNGTLGPFSGIGGGGGGGSSSDSKITMTNTTGWTSKTVSEGTTVILTFSWSSLEDGESTGNGTLTVLVNSVSRATMSIAQGNVSVDVTNYLSANNNVELKVTDSTGNSKSRIYTISVVSLYLTSSFDDTIFYTSSTTFPYIPYGSVSKVVHFLVDGTEIGTTTTTASGRQLSYTIPQQSHGAHTLEAYITATVSGSSVQSDSLKYYPIWVNSASTVPIIDIMRDTATVAQFTTVQIPHIVYTPGSENSTVYVYLNNTLILTENVNRTKQVFAYRLEDVGTATFRFETGSVSKSISFTVTELEIDVHAETENLLLHLSSQGRSNSEANPAVWVSDGSVNVSCQFSGFDWKSNGWIQDEDGITALRVSGNAVLTIPYSMFANDFRSTGRTIEFEFSTKEVYDYDQPIISCYSDGRGLQFTSQNCRIASEQTRIDLQYKEDEHFRIAFVVEKSSGYRRMYSYIDGIMSGVVQYGTDDDFSQPNPVSITVSGQYASVYLYSVRVYGNDLSAEQIVDNWIADTQDGELMLERYTRNNVYDAYGSIVIDQLPSDLPYMVIECAQLPQYKGDKKTCSGRYVNQEDPSKSFTFDGCQIDVQGTSSQYYRRKNYKMKFKNGFTMTSMGGTVSTYQLTSACIPTNAFCMKADVASSEGANNVELVRAYCLTCPYETPAQEENSLVRQGIDGFPIVIFWYDSVNDTTTFLGKYNFNLDKGTEECYGFVSGDESWEIRNNTSNRVLWKSDDYTSTVLSDGVYIPAWLNDFEARYPDTDPAYTDPAQLQTFATWMVSVDPDQATDQLLPRSVTYDGVTYNIDSSDYRNAKFKAELSNYVEMDSCIFYYLFTELFLMVDSRAKNMFPSFIGSSV